MTQHLNLLPQKTRNYDPATVALVVWIGMIVLLLALWSINVARLSAAREAETASKEKLDQTQALLQNRLRERGAELQSEIERLSKRAQVAQQLLAKADSLGNAKGFAPLFGTIAGVNDERLWLSNITVSGAGASLKIDGRSLDQDAVLQYVQRVNTELPDAAKKFTMLELTAEAALKGVDGKPLNVTRFTLR